MENNKEEKRGTTVFLEQRTYSMILEKQLEIFKETNKRVSIQELVSDSIKSGITSISSTKYLN